LAQRLTRGAPAPGSASELARALLSALSFAHARGLLHRDIKPANVFLQRLPDGEERLKLVDFGLAKVASAAAGGIDASLTRTGAVLGTPAYMSPEQIAGDPVDARSDVYSAGVVLFELLAGRLPFVGEPADQLRSHLAAAAPSLASVCSERSFAPELEALLCRALAKAPAERFADAGAMLNALEIVPQLGVSDQGHAADKVSDARAFAPTLMAEALPRANARVHAQSSARSAERSSWLARSLHALFLAGARALAAAALVVIAVALLVIYLSRHHELRRSDLERLRAGVAPRISALRDAADSALRAATAETVHAVDAAPPAPGRVDSASTTRNAVGAKAPATSKGNRHGKR
jgi:hypothetical protein